MAESSKEDRFNQMSQSNLTQQSQCGIQAIPLVKKSISLKMLSAFTSSISLSQELLRLRRKVHLRFPMNLAITQSNQKRVEHFLRLSLQLFFLIRLDSLMSEAAGQAVSLAQAMLKEEYLLIYFGYRTSRDAALSYLFVIVAHAVIECVRLWLPELDVTERMRMDIYHIMVTTTLGVFIGDAAIRGLVAKFTGGRQEKKEPKEPKEVKRVTLGPLEAKTGSEGADQFVAELRKMLRVQPPILPPIVAKSIDSEFDDQLKENISIDKQQLERKLKKFKIYSNQVSSALAEIKGRDNSILPFIKPSKLPFSLQCASLHFQRKPIFRKVEQPEIIPDPPRKERVNKKDLTYWQNQLERLKSQQNTVLKQEDEHETEDDEAEIQRKLNDLCKALRSQEQTHAQEMKQASRRSSHETSAKLSGPASRPTALLLDDNKKTKTVKLEGDNYKIAMAEQQLITLNAPEPETLPQEHSKPPPKQKSNCRKIKELKKARIEFERNCMTEKIRSGTDKDFSDEG